MSDRLAAIILSAGQGTRMQSDLAKVLHPVAGKPMIAWVLDAVAASGADPAVVVTAPQHDRVRSAITGSASSGRVQTVEQEHPRGTAHAAAAASPVLESWCRAGGSVLVLFGDTPLITPQTLSRLAEARRAASNPAVVVLGFEPAAPGLYGRLAVDEAGHPAAIVEARDATPEQLTIGLCNGGAMAVDAEILFAYLAEIGNLNARGEYYLGDLVAIARRHGRSAAHIVCEPLETLGVDSRAGLARAEAAMQDRLRRAAMAAGASLVAPETVFLAHDTRFGRDVTIHPHVVFGPAVSVADGAEILSFSHLQGAIVGRGAVIGPFARLRPGADIGDGARIGNFVEVKNAELAAGAKASHLSYIGDARVGAEANIGAGTITCNYDGHAKHRTEIGAGAFIGSNAALVAPVSVGARAVVGAGSTVTRDVEDDALVVVRGEVRAIPGGAARRRRRKSRGEV